MATIKYSYFLLAGVVGPLFLSSPAIQANNAAIAPTTNYVKAEAAARREESARATQGLRDSAIAMQRVRGNCTVVSPAVPATSEQIAQYPEAKTTANGERLLIEASTVLSEGGRAIDSATGLPMADGFVCTSGRSTGEVIGGQVTQVRNAAAEDFAEFDEYLKKQG